MSNIVLGIDFDNTIVSYDGVFHRAASDLKLIPSQIGRSKDDVRDHLRSIGREDDWTALQGEVYGARMDLAALYDGSIEAVRELKAKGVALRIISHKTRFPFLGPRYDLHYAARRFLVEREITGTPQSLLQAAEIFFEPTIEAKLARIETEGCTVFLDDLPELLNHPKFPKAVRPLLFDPNDAHAGQPHLERVRSWRDLPGVLARV
ncbi:hypothetical protein [Nordella sp. HKS 07]|uniref:hypothetical protein n=1 Tax=Nordella sp. HKS 07 TaxID=2712222 RepID=UPI001FED849E|nr:hypothetical protein [Nordella sp. HKS 07]